jgi:CRISPR-associated protein Csy1
MWRDAGQIERAEALLRAELARPRVKPPLRSIVVMLAGLLRERGALDEAEPLYHQAIAMAPSTSAGEWFNLGRVLAERDDTRAARDAYRRAFELDPQDLRGAFATHLSLPMIYERAAMSPGPADYATGCAPARAGGCVGGRARADQVLDGAALDQLLLAYQGGDDRDLQASYGVLAARMIERGAPQWQHAGCAHRRGWPLARRIRFGVLPRRNGGTLIRSWLTDLDRDRFDVRVYHLYPGDDDVAAEISGAPIGSANSAAAERDHRSSRPRFATMRSTSSSIRSSAWTMRRTHWPRCVLRRGSWRHGAIRSRAAPTIDGFITCGDMEPADADAHYVEPLLRLPGIGTNYRRPVLPARVARAHFRLPEGRVLLLCPQSLFKVHPDNDELFARILADHPAATLVMFDGRHASVTARFMRRMTAAFERNGMSTDDRMIVLPALPHDDYLRVNLVCDAMLDTLHWSGGNTTLDALACGLPVVTLTGAFMRGRQSAAMLGAVGASDLVAADVDGYRAIASRVIDDRAWRLQMAEAIRRGLGEIFDRPEPVRALATLLLETR